jgi:Xaa-Pro aminopeptidase
MHAHAMQSSRLTSVKRLLRLKKCSHILLTDSIDVEYLCGFRSSSVFALLSARENILLSDFRYKEAALAFCAANSQWRFIQTTENDFSILRGLCPVGSVIGFESSEISVDRFDALRKKLNKRKFVKLADSLENIFAVKEKFEISSMRKAAHIGDEALKRTLRYLKTGVSEKEIALRLEEECRACGSEKPSFDTIMLFGARSALPHGKPSDARLKNGDFVLCDFGCTVNGFASDMTRTVVFGKAGLRQKEIHGIVLDAQKHAKDFVREAVAARDVDKCARDLIGKAGNAQWFGHATGHGVGRRIHEPPRISRTNTGLLKNNMVITVEPGIYIPGFGGVRIEDMVVVGPAGGRALTNAPRNLIEVAP